MEDLDRKPYEPGLYKLHEQAIATSDRMRALATISHCLGQNTTSSEQYNELPPSKKNANARTNNHVMPANRIQGEKIKQTQQKESMKAKGYHKHRKTKDKLTAIANGDSKNKRGAYSLVQADGQVHNRHVRNWDTESHASQFAGHQEQINQNQNKPL